MHDHELDRMNALIATQENSSLTLEELHELRKLLGRDLREAGLGWCVAILDPHDGKETEK